MSQGWNVVVLGCEGLVGDALIDLLESRLFPLATLFLLTREPQPGQTRRFAGRTLYMQPAEDFDWQKAQLAFFVAGTAASAHYVRAATDAGCLVIDNSGLFSGMADVPLVVPAITPHILASPPLSACDQRQIIATASAMTCQLLLAIAPLLAHSPVAEMQVTSLLPASAHGKAAVEALAGQSARLLNGQGGDDFAPFSGQLAFNALPFLPDEAGSVPHERRLVAEVRRLLSCPDLPINACCSQIPAFFGLAQLVSVTLAQAITPEQARACWASCPGVRLLADDSLPTPVTHGREAASIALGCVRENPGVAGALQFCSVADNVGFGGALMAVCAAEALLRERGC